MARPAPAGRQVRWTPAPRARSLATAALLALLAAVLTGHAALLLLAAPALGALALMPRRPPPEELTADVALSASRCFEGEDLTITATVRGPGGRLDDITIQLETAPQVSLTDGTSTQTFLQAGVDPRTSARWVVRPGRWGRYSPGDGPGDRPAGPGRLPDLRAGAGGPAGSLPPAAPVRPRLIPAELLRRIGEHTGRAVGEGVEFAGIRPYVPGDRSAGREPGGEHPPPPAAREPAVRRPGGRPGDHDRRVRPGRPVADRSLDTAVHGAAALATAYLRVSDRAGIVLLGGALRWLGPAAGDRQFYRIAEMMLQARYESFVTPDIGRIPRTALPPGTLVVVFSPLLDPRAFGAVTDLRQRGFPLIVVDTLRDEPPADPRSTYERLTLRLWRLDRAATRSALRDLGVPVLGWPGGTELDSVLAPLRRPPPGLRRLAARS